LQRRRPPTIAEVDVEMLTPPTLMPHSYSREPSLNLPANTLCSFRRTGTAISLQPAFVCDTCGLNEDTAMVRRSVLS
jgi:hypothetical protein